MVDKIFVFVHGPQSCDSLDSALLSDCTSFSWTVANSRSYLITSYSSYLSLLQSVPVMVCAGGRRQWRNRLFTTWAHSPATSISPCAHTSEVSLQSHRTGCSLSSTSLSCFPETEVLYLFKSHHFYLALLRHACQNTKELFRLSLVSSAIGLGCYRINWRVQDEVSWREVTSESWGFMGKCRVWGCW